MSAGVYNIPNIEQGASFSLVVTCKDGGGNAYDLTDFYARGQLRLSYGSVDYVPFLCVVDDPTSGSITISLSPAQTASLKATRYVYDVEIEASNGEVERVLKGSATVTPEVTK